MRVTVYDPETLAPITAYAQLERLPDGRAHFASTSSDRELIVGNHAITIDGKSYVSLSIEGGDFLVISREDWMAFHQLIPACCPRCRAAHLTDEGNAFVEERPAQHRRPGWGTIRHPGYRFRCGSCKLTFVLF